MVLYTIGSGRKSACDFFTLLQKNGVKRVIDIRLKNTSQLAGYTKKADLEYFLKAIANIDYIHMPEFAPTENIIDDYKTKKTSRIEFEKEYTSILDARQIQLSPELFDGACLLSSDPSVDQCHRRLLAEYLVIRIAGLKVVHL